MKEFIIKDDEVKLYEHDKTDSFAEDFKFVTNDEKDEVSVSWGMGIKPGMSIPRVSDNRIEKNVIFTDVGDYDITHKNYMTYLDTAYSRDFGIVIKPEFMWYTILCELASMIKEDPETYREYFSDRPDKQTIDAHTDKFYNVPVDTLTKKILEKIPTNFTDDMIVPKFTTLDKDSEFALRSAFLDAVSPFYYPMLYACGYNKIKILGEQSDYLLVRDTLTKISNIIPEFVDYTIKVGNVIDDIIKNWDDVEFWKEICKTSSGYGETIVDGWFTNLFLGEVRNMYQLPEHLTKVDYSDEHGDDYTLYVGILSSKVEDGYLIPNFNKIVAKVVKPSQNKKLEKCQTDSQKQ